MKRFWGWSMVQIFGTALFFGMSVSIFNIARIGHTLLGISLVLPLIQIKRSIFTAKV